jgi:hypothetical protein
MKVQRCERCFSCNLQLRDSLLSRNESWMVKGVESAQCELHLGKSNMTSLEVNKVDL